MGRVVIGGAALLAVLAFFWIDPLGVKTTEPPEPDASTSPSEAVQGKDAPTLQVAEKPPVAEPALLIGPDVDLGRVHRAKDLHGIVVLRDGSPVPGASVRVEDVPWRGLMINRLRLGETAELAATTTGPRGTFKLPLREGERGRLVVHKDGYPTRQMWLASAGEAVRVVLDGGVSLAVDVKAPDGAPAADVLVQMSGAGAGVGPGAPDSVTTDAQGIARRDGLDPRGAVYVWATPQRDGWGPSEIKRITLPAQGVHEYEIVLPEGRTLRGTVTDASTGAPLAGAKVGVGWQMDPAVTADETGAYVLHGWTSEAAWSVTAAVPGYVRGKVIVEDEQVQVDFALVAGMKLSGRIVDESGKPVADAVVAVVGSVGGNQQQRLSLANGRSKASGRFALGGLAADMALSIQIRHRAHARRIVDIDAVNKAEHDVGDIVLRPPLTIAGTVVREDGTAVARMPVQISGANPDRAERRASKEPADSFYGTEEDIVTDDLGRFTVTDMCEGTFEISVLLANITVTLDGSQERTEVTITVGETRALRVTVLDPDGKPLTDGVVTARHKGQAISGRLDTAGRTELVIPIAAKQVVVVPFGREARAEYIHKHPVPVPEDSDTLVIRLKRAQLLRGIVVKPDGTPFTQALVVGTVEGRQVHHATTDEKGRFSMKTTDEVDLSVDGQVRRNGARAREPFVGERNGVPLGATDVRIQTVSLAGDASLSVRVMGPDGPLEGLSVILMPYQPSVGHKTTDADGVARFEKLSAIERTVKAFGKTPDGQTWPERAVQATPGGAEVTITMAQPILVTGMVLGTDGKPVGGAILSVRAVGTNRHVNGGHLPEDGTFTISVPAATGLRFTAHKMIDKVLHMADMVFDATPTEKIVLKLVPTKR